MSATSRFLNTTDLGCMVFSNNVASTLVVLCGNIASIHQRLRCNVSKRHSMTHGRIIRMTCDEEVASSHGSPPVSGSWWTPTAIFCWRSPLQPVIRLSGSRATRCPPRTPSSSTNRPPHFACAVFRTDASQRNAHAPGVLNCCIVLTVGAYRSAVAISDSVQRPRNLSPRCARISCYRRFYRRYPYNS